MSKPSKAAMTLQELKNNGCQGVIGLYFRGLVRSINGSIDRFFDKIHGIHATGEMPLSDLDVKGINVSQSEGYESTSVLEWRQIIHPVLERIPTELSTFVFVDYGSGTGKVLFLASYYNFKKIIGIEFARDLNAIAIKNIANFKCRGQRCFNIKSICVDALNFQVPTDSCVFFFYNPFKEELMSKILDKIVLSYESKPRKMYFIYSNPVCKEVFDRQHILKEFDKTCYEKKSFLPTMPGLKVYETK